MYPLRLVSRTVRVASDEAARLDREERTAVERVLGGETAAFRVLVERHQRGVFSVVHRMIHHAADANDLAQQTFVSAFSALRSFDVTMRFSSWLYRIAVNLAKDYLKSKKRGEVSLSPSHESGQVAFAVAVPMPDEVAIRSERMAELERALSRLKVTDREVLVLKDVQDLSYEEMREILGKPITALKIQVVRARLRLRAELDRMIEKGAL